MGKKYILVIDDDIKVCRVIESLLDISGYIVTSVLNGREGLMKVLEAQATQTMFDLIITDIKMPGISGFGVIKNIKAMDITVPVLVITGFATTEIMTRIQSIGCDGWLEKPFKKEQLKERVETLIKRNKNRTFVHLE